MCVFKISDVQNIFQNNLIWPALKQFLFHINRYLQVKKLIKTFLCVISCYYFGKLFLLLKSIYKSLIIYTEQEEERERNNDRERERERKRETERERERERERGERERARIRKRERRVRETEREKIMYKEK